jgi:hypothetical protein
MSIARLQTAQPEAGAYPMQYDAAISGRHMQIESPIGDPRSERTCVSLNYHLDVESGKTISRPSIFGQISMKPFQKRMFAYRV